MSKTDGRVAPALAAHLKQNRAAIVSAWYRNQFNEKIFDQFDNPFAREANQGDVERGHLRPVVDLLSEYARTGDVVYRDLYRAERRRYAPHRQGLKALNDYFRAILPADEESAVQGLNDPGAREWLREVHESLVNTSGGSVVRVLTVGDCLHAEIQGFLMARGLEANLEFDFRYYYFSAQLGVNILEEGLSKTIRDDKVDLIAVSYLSYEGIPLYRSLLQSADRGDVAQVADLIAGINQFIRNHLDQIRSLTDAPILLHDACGLPLSRWRRRIPVLPAMSEGRKNALVHLNRAIDEIVRDVSNCFLVDETAVVAQYGARHSATNVLPKWIRHDADMHPAYLGRYLADSYFTIIRDWASLRKTKLLLVDFDNTLWEGVMADGPVTHFRERQQLLKQLSEQGILLAAVSKNDPANVRWSEMALAESDFVSLKIGWGLKADSISQIATELNLGSDSFVLIDDNPAEREMVSHQMPGVVCIDPTVPATWHALERLFRMPNTRQTDEARQRTQMYREQKGRDEAVRSTSDYPALMATLSLRASIGKAKNSDLDRVVELIQRTNQFNTTTIRSSRGEIKDMLSSSTHQVIVGELADKFGDLGVVGVAVVRADAESSTIESFVMSCRAMGFGFEQALLNNIITQAAGRSVIGRFVPSSRNEPASTLYSSAGFAERSTGEWVLPTGSTVQSPQWIDLKNR